MFFCNSTTFRHEKKHFHDFLEIAKVQMISNNGPFSAEIFHVKICSAMAMGRPVILGSFHKSLEQCMEMLLQMCSPVKINA